MASTFTTLGIEKMATGENAGTWGDKTNTNLDIVNTAISGYVEQAVTNGGTLALGITDGASTATAQNAVIKLTGTITGNSIVTVPDSVEKVYIVANGTSGAFTVQFKTASGSGITFGSSDKGTRLVFSDGTNIVDAGGSVGAHDLNGEVLTLDADGDTTITADTDDQIDIKIAGTDQLTIKDGALSPVTTNDIDLGTASLEFKNAFFDGTVTSDAFAGPLTGNVTGNASGTAATVTGAAQSNITSLGTLTTLTVDDITINGSTISDAGDFTLDVEGDIILDANGADVFLKDAGTTYGSLTNTSGNLIVKSGTTTALTFSGADVTIAGDLTVSGDDITMGTNTAGNLLVADGTNFNSIAISSLSEISTAASGDLLLAVDVSGGGLKKIARSTVVAGLATDSAIANIVEDTSPQLGGNLDTNSQNILIDDAHFIADESGNEQIIFQTTGSAVNQFDITNAASGAGPRFSATGGDSNIDLDILAKGTGHVTIRGNTNSGSIQFNCESNSHGQQVKAQPHSAGVTNVMLLPAGADSTLVSLVSTDTLTNKTLTSPKINEDVAVTSTATEINALDGITAVVGELNALDIGATAVGTAVASKAVILDSSKDYTGIRNFTISGEIDAATGDFSGAVDVAGATTTAAITASGIVKTDDTTDATSTTDGSLQTDGGLSVAKDTIMGNDLKLLSDSAVLVFGAGSDATLTHTNDTGLTLNSTNKLMFNDASQFVQGSSATVLSIGATDEIDLSATAIDINGTCDVSGTLTNSSAAVKVAGKETIWVPSNAMTPTTTNGAARATVETTSGRPDMEVLDFDPDADEFAQFAVAFPKSWNLGTVTCQFMWSGSASTDGVSLQLQGVAFADNDSIDTAYGTAVVVDDSAQGAVEELYLTAESGAITIAGSPGDNELVYFRVGRDVSDSNDDMDADCRLHGIKLFFTTDAANDA